jgi:hypothetical protein
MRIGIKCCILWYVDRDRKTYNPGLIITNNTTDDEICKISCEMMSQGRHLTIFTSSVVDDVRQLPSLDKPIGEGLEGYTYDPWLMW